MKYTNRHYAKALYEAIRDVPEVERKVRLRRFLALVRKNRDLARLRLILQAVERQWLSESGLKKVELESAAPVTAELKKEIENILGKKILFSEKLKPELLAGVKILVNDELLIDASAQRQLNRIFAKH